MATEKSSEDVREGYVASMGDDLGGCVYALYKETVWVHAKWLEYRELYAHSKERLDLLNRTAGFFFQIIQDELWDGVLLHIARITDPVRSGGYENLTVQMLPALIQDQGLKHDVVELLGICLKKTEFAREHRNKRLAHRDLLHASQNGATQLSGVSRAHIEEMLSSLREVMNRIDGHYRDTTVAYEHFVSRTGAVHLVGALKISEEKEAGRVTL